MYNVRCYISRRDTYHAKCVNQFLVKQETKTWKFKTRRTHTARPAAHKYYHNICIVELGLVHLHKQHQNRANMKTLDIFYHQLFRCNMIFMSAAGFWWSPPDRLGTEFKWHHLFFMTNSSCNKRFDILDLQWSITIVTLFQFTASQTGQICTMNENYQYIHK